MKNTQILLGVVVATSAFFVYMMSDRIIAPGDWAYIMEPAYRVTLGQMAYRDFFLVLTPGIIYTVAGLMLFGGGNLPMLVFTIISQGVTVVLTYSIYRRVTKDATLSLFLVLPTAATFQAFYPFPSYETGAMLFILGALLCALKGLERKSSVALWVFAGVLAAIAPLFKQNTGGAYLVFFHVAIILARFVSHTPPTWKNILSALVGSAAVSAAFFGWIIGAGALDNFIYQTFTFPGQIRNPLELLPKLALNYFNVYALALYASAAGGFLLLRRLFGGAYRKISFRGAALLAFVGFPALLALALELAGKSPAYNLRNYYGSVSTALILAGIATLAYDLFNAKRRKLAPTEPLVLAPIVVIAVSHLSQGIYGSSLFLEFPNIMLIGAILLKRHEAKIESAERLVGTAVATVAVALFMGYTSWGLLRYHFNAFPESIYNDAKHPKLNFIGTPHTVLQNMDSLAFYIQENIPKKDPIVEIPYTDPIYYLTDRVPPVFFSSFDMYPPIGGSFPLERTDEQLFRNNIKWFIIRLEPHPDDEYLYPYYEVMNKIRNKYTKVDSLPGYEIYLNESYGK